MTREAGRRPRRRSPGPGDTNIATWESPRDAAAQAAILAEVSGDTRTLGEACFQQAYAAIRLGDPVAAKAAAARCRTLFDDQGDELGIWRASAMQALCMRLDGEADRSIRLLQDLEARPPFGTTHDRPVRGARGAFARLPLRRAARARVEVALPGRRYGPAHRRLAAARLNAMQSRRLPLRPVQPRGGLPTARGGPGAGVGVRRRPDDGHHRAQSEPGLRGARAPPRSADGGRDLPSGRTLQSRPSAAGNRWCR